MSQTAAHLVDHVIPCVPVRQWVLSLPIPLRVLLAAQPELATPVLQVVQHVTTRHLLDVAGIKADEGHGGAVTLIQRFGSAANLNIHLHCLVLDGVYRCGADGVPGTKHLVMSPLEFMQRLAALVPRPRLHLIRLHGVLAPNTKLRSLVVPQQPPAQAQAATEAALAADCEVEPVQASPHQDHRGHPVG
jgi:hypothetical protein